MDHGSGDKPSAFTWAMGRLILQRIADGETVKAITTDPRMPAYCTVFQWMKVHPEFGDKVREVRVLLAEDRRTEREARRLAKGPKRRSGARSTYTEATAALVLARVREGASVTEIAAMEGGPSFKALYAWLRDRPDFRADFIEACDWRDGWLAFQKELVVDEVWALGIPGAEAKMRALEARRGRLRPKLYRK